MPALIPESARSEVLELLNKNITLSAIAKSTGVSKATISRLRAAARGTPQPSVSKKIIDDFARATDPKEPKRRKRHKAHVFASAETKATALALIRQGEPTKKVARRSRVSTTTVNMWRREIGVEPPRSMRKKARAARNGARITNITDHPEPVARYRASVDAKHDDSAPRMGSNQRVLQAMNELKDAIAEQEREKLVMRLAGR